MELKDRDDNQSKAMGAAGATNSWSSITAQGFEDRAHDLHDIDIKALDGKSLRMIGSPVWSLDREQSSQSDILAVGALLSCSATPVA